MDNDKKWLDANLNSKISDKMFGDVDNKITGKLS
jgi:hypothetical protein